MKPHVAAATPRSQIFSTRAGGLDRHALWFLGVLYVVAHGWLFVLADAWYWDDWVLKQAPSSDLIALYWENGLPWFGYGHVALLEVGPPLSRTIVFLAHLLAGGCVYGILQTCKDFSREDRLAIAGLFLVLPFFSSRVTLITVWYSIGAGVFFLAWYLWVRFERGGNVILRVFVPLLFFVSFSVQSLLVFFALPVLHVWYLQRAWSVEGTLRFIRRHLDLIAVPFVFWFAKLALLTPYGMFEGYLTIEPRSRFLLYVPAYVLREFLTLPIDVLAVAILLPLVWWFLYRFERPTATEKQRHAVALAWFGFGLGVVCLAALPYLLVGKLPTFSDWGSRHQLLMPLGAALAIVAAGKLLPPLSKRIWICSWLAISLALTMANYVDYSRDWIKQQALSRALAQVAEIREGTTFPVKDRTRAYNANGRVYRLYEYAGLLNTAFAGDQRRYADNLRKESLEQWRSRRAEESEKFTARFGLEHYRPAEPDCLIVIERGPFALSGLNLARAIYYKMARRDAYYELLEKVLSVDCQPLPGS